MGILGNQKRNCLECPCFAGLPGAGLPGAGLPGAGLPGAGLPGLPGIEHCAVQHCAVQHGGREGLGLAVMVRAGATNNFLFLANPLQAKRLQPPDRPNRHSGHCV